MMKESFLKYLRYERNYSDKTVISYGIDIREFESYFKEIDEKCDYVSVDADMVRGWVVRLMTRGYSASSVNRKLSSLRSFYKYLLLRGWILIDPVRGVRGPKRKKTLPVFVRDADMDRLLDEVEFEDNFEGVRDHAILKLFYMTGVRLSELVGLKDSDVDFASSVIKITGKRNRQRFIPFTEELKNELHRYLLARAEFAESCESFFVRKEGKKMYPTMVYSLVKKELSKVVSSKKKSPHVLRHTFATSMLNHGAKLDAVKELLGHKSIMTTEVYTHMTFEDLKKVYGQAHPRA